MFHSKIRTDMVFKFRIVSDEVTNFKREITIDASATFQDLKNAICTSVGYDKNQLCSFFTCSDGWEKEKEITLEDMGTDSDQDIWLMDDTVLEDMIDDEGQKLLFVFDYMTERAFYMEMKEMIPGKTLKDPVCSLSLGQAPSQITDLDELDSISESKAEAAAVAAAAAAASTMPLDDDLDDEFGESTQFNEDEFDAEGYSELEF